MSEVSQGRSLVTILEACEASWFRDHRATAGLYIPAEKLTSNSTCLRPVLSISALMLALIIVQQPSPNTRDTFSHCITACQSEDWKQGWGRLVGGVDYSNPLLWRPLNNYMYNSWILNIFFLNQLVQVIQLWTPLQLAIPFHNHWARLPDYILNHSE